MKLFRRYQQEILRVAAAKNVVNDTRVEREGEIEGKVETSGGEL